MNTLRTLRRDCAPETLQAINQGTAPADLRQAYALQLRSLAAGSLEAAPIQTQGDMFSGTPHERNADGTAQELFF